MKVLLQRVTRASVTVDGRRVGEIARGLLLFVGVEKGDSEGEARALAEKVSRLRVFADAGGKLNLDVHEAQGAILVVSQFTLVGSTSKGRRPSFDAAASPESARALVDLLAEELRRQGLRVEAGIFGADMSVELVNDGPLTFLVEMPPARPSPAFLKGGAGEVPSTET